MSNRMIVLVLFVFLLGCNSTGIVTDINGSKKGSYFTETCVTDNPIQRIVLQRDANAINPKCEEGFEFCEGKLEEKNGEICMAGMCTAPKCDT